MRKVISLGFIVSVVILIFSGCAYHNSTAEYAQKNNMSKKLYNDVMIKCVTKKDLKPSYDLILMQKIGMRLGYKLKEECKFYLKNYRGETATLNYNRCMNTYLSSDPISVSSRIVDGVNVDDVILTNEKERKIKIGSIGLDKNNGYTVLFYSGHSGYRKVMADAMRDYIREVKPHCSLSTK